MLLIQYIKNYILLIMKNSLKIFHNILKLFYKFFVLNLLGYFISVNSLDNDNKILIFF